MTTTFRDETKVLTIEILKGKDYPQWVCAAQPGIKLSDGTIAEGKEPINPKTGGNAMADIPGTWASFERACKKWQSDPERLMGIGFVLAKEQSITCVDLDECIDENGELKPWARAIVERLNSYTEYSPSGLGLHIWVRGNIPKNVPRDTPGIQVEMYDNNHYMTITGSHFDGTPKTIEPRKDEIRLLYLDIWEAREQAKEKAKAEKRKAKGQATNSAEQQQEIKGTTNDTRYGLKALQDECNILASTTEGSRNHQLNKSAYAIGQIITHENPKKRVTRETAEQALTDAALSIGLGDGEIEKTLESGIDSGMDNPREDDTADSPTQDTGQQLQATTGDGHDKSVPDGSSEPESIYTCKTSGMYARLKDKSTKEFYDAQLSNFVARIVADIRTNDGAEEKHTFELQAWVQGRVRTFEIPAREYMSLSWVPEHLGARAIVKPGMSIKSHLVTAIQECSKPTEKNYYAHTGWTNIDGKMVYLHAGGYIGELSELNFTNSKIGLNSPVFENDTALQANLESSELSELSELKNIYKDVRVKLSGHLDRYKIERGGMPIADAVRASLAYLDLASDAITFPLYASLWRSLLPQVDYGVHIAGQTGRGKTALIALLQQHFGRGMHSRRLPCQWIDTENSLEMKLFQIKDAIAVIDDFKPVGSQSDQSRLHGKANRVFMSIGNGAARGRLDGNLNQRAEREPRCLVISTGEDIPRGQSLKARGIILVMDEIITGAGSEESLRLTAAQKQARDGVYETAMYGYIEWLAPRISEIESNLQGLLEVERDSLRFGGHGRLETNTANMLLGFRYFLQFAQDCQAITAEEARELQARCMSAVCNVASVAVAENASDKPSEQYRRLIVSALQAKTAHLETLEGKNPGTAYGWKQSERTFKNSAGEQDIDETYNPCGDMIGAIDGDDVYLLPGPAYKAVVHIGSATGDNMTTTKETLNKYLFQDGLLASTSRNAKVPTLLVRKRISKKQEYVLHFKKSVLFGSDDDDPTPTTTEPTEKTTYPTYQNVNSLNSLDSAGSNVALQDTSEVSEVQKNENEGLNLLNSPSKHSSADVQHLLGELQTTLEKRDRTGIKRFNWRDDMTEPWPRLGREEFIARVSAAIESNDEKLIHAAKVATLRTLGKYDERRGI